MLMALPLAILWRKSPIGHCGVRASCCLKAEWGIYGLILSRHLPCVQVWQEQATEGRASPLQMDVSDALSGMGISHETEALTPERHFSIDIKLAAAKLAIEVDGDSHFACNTQRLMGMLSSTKCQHILLYSCMPVCAAACAPLNAGLSNR